MTERRLAMLLLAGLLGLAGTSCITAPPVAQPETLRLLELYQRHGMEAFNAGEYVEAGSMLKRVLALQEGMDNQQGIAYSLINMAETELRTRRYEEAAGYLARAERTSLYQSDDTYRRHVVLLQATLALRTENLGLAESLLTPLLPPFDGDRPAGKVDQITLSAVANRVHLALNKADEDAGLWIRRLARSLEASGNEDPRLRARLLRYQAEADSRSGNTSVARQRLEEALGQYRAVLFRPGIAATLVEQSRLDIQQQDWEPAQERLLRVVTVRARLHDVAGITEALELLAGVEEELGNTEKSAQLARLALDIRDNRPGGWTQLRKLFSEK